MTSSEIKDFLKLDETELYNKYKKSKINVIDASSDYGIIVEFNKSNDYKEYYTLQEFDDKLKYIIDVLENERQSLKNNAIKKSNSFNIPMEDILIKIYETNGLERPDAYMCYDFYTKVDESFDAFKKRIIKKKKNLIKAIE